MPGLRPTPSIRASAPQPRRCDSDSNIDATAMQPQRRCNHDGNATATTAMVGATSEQRRDHDARNVTAMAARRQRNGDAVATQRRCDRDGVTATRRQCDHGSNNGWSDGSTIARQRCNGNVTASKDNMCADKAVSVGAGLLPQASAASASGPGQRTGNATVTRPQRR